MAENYYDYENNHDFNRSSVSGTSAGMGRGGPRNYISETPNPPVSRGRGIGRGRGRVSNNDVSSTTRSFQSDNRYKKRSREYDEDETNNNNGERSVAPKKYREATTTTSKSKNVKQDREQIERERKSRMDRLRAEIEEEERDIAMKENGQNIESNDVQKQSTAKDTIRMVHESELEGLEEDDQMALMLGFSGGFGSTKGKVVEDNLKTAARGAAGKNKARKYRQYMNRKGGFNRPLDKTH